MYAVSTGTTIEGISIFKPIQLRMRTESILVFQHNFVLQHKLDSNSPLYDVWKNLGLEANEHLASGQNEQTEPLNLSLHVTLVGDDALLQNQVHARHIYHINDFRFDCRFDDMVIPEHVHHNLPAPRNYAYNTRSLSIMSQVSTGGNNSVIDYNNFTEDENDVMEDENEEMEELAPKFIMACGRIDDTVVATRHITDKVIRKVADAMALHHLGEDTYKKHLSKDHQRYQEGKALAMYGSESDSNEPGSGRSSQTGRHSTSQWQNSQTGRHSTSPSITEVDETEEKEEEKETRNKSSIESKEKGVNRKKKDLVQLLVDTKPKEKRMTHRKRTRPDQRHSTRGSMFKSMRPDPVHHHLLKT